MIDSYDSVLLEMATDPRSEAVFATMSMQLEQTGGFDRVLALLNQLVDDGRKQLHVANKLWRKTNARCDVSKMKFAERQNFYENKKTILAQMVTEITEEKVYAAASVADFKTYADWFAKFKIASEIRAADNKKYNNKKFAAAKNAVAKTDKAIKTVTSWSTKKKPAFVQAELEEVAASYLEVKNFNIVIPEAFVELAANDGAVRQRLLEWLGSLRITFLEVQSHYEQKAASRAKIFASLLEATKDILAVYSQDIKLFNQNIVSFATHVRSATESASFYTKLAAQNAKLVRANKQYCRVEKRNYSKTKSMIEGQLKLFGEIRTYFRNNYSKISRYIKNKYNRSG